MASNPRSELGRTEVIQAKVREKVFWTGGENVCKCRGRGQGAAKEVRK
jgi:hypothetical protein